MARLRRIRDELVLELLADDVATDDRPVLRQVEPVVDDLLGIGGSTDSGAISVTRPIRKIPSSPSTTSVGVSCFAAKIAVRNASSVWVSSLPIQPRSPACGAVAESVDTVLAMSSHALPPLMSASAVSILVLAAAIASAVGAAVPFASGSTSICQACRASLIVASSVSRASMSPSLTVTPSCRELGLDAVVDDPLEGDRDELFAGCR